MQPSELLVSELLRAHPRTAARLLDQVGVSQTAGILDSTDLEAAQTVFPLLSFSVAAGCLSQLESGRAGALLTALPPGGAAALLRRLDPAERSRLLEPVPEPERRNVEVILRYPEGTAGSMMDPLALAVSEDLTVSETLQLLQKSAEGSIYYAFFLTPEHRLSGVLSLQELIQASRAEVVRQIMHRDVLFARAETGVFSLLENPAWLRVDALPVVDEQGIFIGVLRHRMLRRAAQQMQPPPVHPPGLETALSVGEVYWVGLSEVMRGVASAVHEEEREKKPVNRAGAE